MSPGSIRAEKGPLVLGWVLGSAGLAERLSSGNTGWLTSAASRVSGFVPEPYRGSCFLEHAGTVSLSQPRGYRSWGLVQRGLVSWSSIVASRLVVVFRARLGFLSAVTD